MGEHLFNAYFKSNQTEDLICKNILAEKANPVKKISEKSNQIKANMKIKMALNSLRRSFSFFKESYM